MIINLYQFINRMFNLCNSLNNSLVIKSKPNLFNSLNKVVFSLFLFYFILFYLILFYFLKNKI